MGISGVLTDMQAKGNRLISLYGQIGSIKRVAAPDLAYGGAPVDTWYTARLATIAYDAGVVDDAVVVSGDVQIYISSAGLAIIPSPGDLVTVNGKQYIIINGDPQSYEGDTNVFLVQARLVRPT
ncbi:hypothetical protein FHR76_004606 [Rhizobium sp. RAS22]|nr:hypothetical protein [Rhizobium sp. RAS22]